MENLLLALLARQSCFQLNTERINDALSKHKQSVSFVYRKYYTSEIMVIMNRKPADRIIDYQDLGNTKLSDQDSECLTLLRL